MFPGPDKDCEPRSEPEALIALSGGKGEERKLIEVINM
jgi:hypothetical protein